MSYVQTPQESRFGGLILPQETLAAIVRHEVGSSYQSVNPRNKNTAGWTTSMGSADADSIPYANPLRWQARDLDRNNPLAAGALDTIVDGVVATGIRPQSNVDRKILGLTEEQASEWQSEAERFYYMWADSKDGDVTRESTFWELQALVLLNTLLSGDVFSIRRYKERPGSVFGTCIQLVEADRCETPPEKDLGDGRVTGGVETDADGEARRYWFLKNHPGDMYLRNKPLAADEYVGVNAYDEDGVPLCLHHFAKRRPDQKRGISVLAPVLEQFKMLGRYTEAELTAAVVSGMFSVFVKTNMPSVGGLPGTIPGMVGGNQLAPKGTGLTKLQSGMIVDLAPGEDVEFANPNRPNTAFDPFTATILKHIGVGLGLPHEVLIKHFTASYSASRAALMEAWKTFRRRREWLVAGFCQPTYAWVISEAVARGYLRAPGFFDDPMRRAAWLGTTWRGSPMGMLDPLKEAKAAKEWLSVPGLTSIQEQAAIHFGNDSEDVMAQNARERRQIADLPPDPLAQQGTAPGSQDEPGQEGMGPGEGDQESAELLQAITGLIVGPDEDDDD